MQHQNLEFSPRAHTSKTPSYALEYWWVAEVFHTPPCAVILSHDKASKNGTGCDLLAV